MKRRSLTAATAAVLALGMTCALGACEGTVPTVKASTSAASATPDLTEAQERQIRTDLLATIKECNDT